MQGRHGDVALAGGMEVGTRRGITRLTRLANPIHGLTPRAGLLDHRLCSVPTTQTGDLVVAYLIKGTIRDIYI